MKRNAFVCHGTRSALIAGMLGLLLAALPAHADDDVWVGARAGTLGFGLEGTWRPVPFMDLRAGFNAFSTDDERSEAGVDYDVELDLSSFYATANFRVPLSPFRATVGVFSNGNEIGLTSRDSTTFDIGDTTFSGADVGTLRGDVGFDSLAPYAGVGLDFRIADRFGLHFDAGVLFQGTPELTLTADGLLADDALFQSELEAERAELQDELDDFELYPVLSVGISVNF